jgi:hypothetical protein
MGILTDKMRSFIGIESDVLSAPEPVELGAVRRYAQAIMDEDPIFANDDAAKAAGLSGAVAPPLFPVQSFRRAFGAPDPLVEHATDPDFDGSVGSSMRGLPELPTVGLVRLNGGSEIELLRYALHGERIFIRARYASITERETSKGPMIIVVIETSYFTAPDDVIMRVRSTSLLREPQK